MSKTEHSTTQPAEPSDFVRYEHSGAVSILIKDYLQSTAGKEQLEKLRPSSAPVPDKVKAD